MKRLILPVLLMLFGSVITTEARIIIVAADSTGDYLHVADAADSATAGDTILVRDGTYMENPIYVDSAVTILAEHNGRAQLWMLNPDWLFITLSGTAKIVGLQIIGHWAGFDQTLIEINGGPTTINNCLIWPRAHWGVQMEFNCRGQTPMIRFCQFYASGGSNTILQNHDSTRVWMPFNYYYHTTDTVLIHSGISWDYPGGEVYISPVLDSFQWLAVEERPSASPLLPSVQVYPNPSHDGRISLDIGGTKPIQGIDIYNLLGQRVWSWPGVQMLAPNFSGVRVFLSAPLSLGTYFLVVTRPQLRQTAKIAIIH